MPATLDHSQVIHRTLRFAALQTALCLILLAAWWRLGQDDSYIFLVYARNLATTGQFAFNPGEISYGFSSPAYVLFLAGLARLTHTAVSVALSNAAGVVLCTLSSLALWKLWEEFGDTLATGILLPSILFSGPWFFTVWFLYGMESGLAIFGLLCFLLSLARLWNGRSNLTTLLLGAFGASLFALTRLESAAFLTVLLCAAAVTLRNRRSVLQLACIAASAALVELAWLRYAHRTFGTYMPWTATARLIYYIFPRYHVTGQQYFALGLLGRLRIASEALSSFFVNGPMKMLLIALPMVLAATFLRRKVGSPLERWMLGAVALAFLGQMILFAALFPLAQNRHFAPYFAALWAILVPSVVAILQRTPLQRRLTLAGACALWIFGALQYRALGASTAPIHALAQRGPLHPNDRLAGETIGILAFESRAHIIDLGGLTDRDAWPLLSSGGHNDIRQVIAWEQQKGASLFLVGEQYCPARDRWGSACLIPASQARPLLETVERLHWAPPTPAP